MSNNSFAILAGRFPFGVFTYLGYLGVANTSLRPKWTPPSAPDPWLRFYSPDVVVNTNASVAPRMTGSKG